MLIKKEKVQVPREWLIDLINTNLPYLDVQSGRVYYAYDVDKLLEHIIKAEQFFK